MKNQMKMDRIKQIAACVAAALILLAACGGGEPAATPTVEPAAAPTAEPTVAPTAEPTDEPAVEAAAAPESPLAAPESPLAAPESPLAEPAAGEAGIPWAEAVALLQSGQVEMAAQSHTLDVELTLKDGSTVTTREPAIDDLFRVVEECGEPCADILLATE